MAKIVVFALYGKIFIHENADARTNKDGFLYVTSATEPAIGTLYPINRIDRVAILHDDDPVSCIVKCANNDLKEI